MTTEPKKPVRDMAEIDIYDEEPPVEDDDEDDGE